MSGNLLSEYSELPHIGQNGTSLDSFLDNLFEDSEAKYATFSFPLDAIDPLAYLEMCWDNESFQYYWEKPTDEFAIAAGNELVTISAAGHNRFQEIHNKFENLQQSTAEYADFSHPYSGMLLLGGFSFADQINDERWESFSPASFTVPRWMIIKDGKFTLATIGIEVGEFSSPNEIRLLLDKELQKVKRTITLHLNGSKNGSDDISFNAALPKNGTGFEQWTSSVVKAKKHICQQHFDKIVLARNISIPKTGDFAPTQILNRLRQQYINCYNFLIHKATGKTFLGSTPERLGAFRNRLLLTDALAGSIKRGKTASEDSVLSQLLSRSRKNRNEHSFVIKDIEERLYPFVTSIDRSEQPEIKKLSNVQHLYTPIRAQLKDNANLLEVIGRLHPTPAVGGYPWKDAAPFIKKLENFNRGWYAGPVGWFNTHGVGEFAVAIRSGLLTESKAHFFAGCGIVEDSDPAAEWEETNLKLEPMLSALQYD